MRLSTKGRYAVMAMVDLAQHSGEGPVCLSEIAERQEISLSYLEQLFAKLRRGGIVNSVRGPGGGYLLAHGRDATRIADIILAVDEPLSTGRDARLPRRPQPMSDARFVGRVEQPDPPLPELGDAGGRLRQAGARHQRPDPARGVQSHRRGLMLVKL